LQRVGIAECQNRERLSARLNFDQCNVVALVGSDEFRRVPRLVPEYDFNGLRALHHVKIRQNVPLGINHEAGARAFHRHRVHPKIVLRCFGKNIGNGGSGLAVDAHVQYFVGAQRGVALRKAGVLDGGRVRIARNGISSFQFSSLC
jgi:hypothetical protein